MRDDTDQSRGGLGRRKFLQTVAAGAAIPIGVSRASGRVDGAQRANAGSGPVPPGPEAFHVRGTQTIRVEITPDALTRHVRKRSPELKRRYDLDPPVLVDVERYERPDPEGDDLPERRTVTRTSPWETYYANEEEWEAYLTGAQVEFGTSEVSTADHAPVEEEHPYATWEYNQLDGGYEIEAPMNVISPETIPDVAGVLDDNGWTLAIVQHDRWAWNSATNRFETQHKSAATGTFGVLGRKHVRMWEFEGYVSGSAHVDDEFIHEAISFDDAEQAIEGVFDDEPGWSGFEDYYDLDNGGMLDHDGYATELYEY